MFVDPIAGDYRVKVGSPAAMSLVENPDGSITIN